MCRRPILLLAITVILATVLLTPSSSVRIDVLYGSSANAKSSTGIEVFGTNLRGRSRPTVVVKTKNLTGLPNTAKVGVVTTFDTGSDDFNIKTFAADLGISNDASLTVEVGGVETRKGDTVTEDSIALKENLQNTGKMVSASTTADTVPNFVALGSDALINGLVAIYVPLTAPVKKVLNSIPSATSGNLQFFPALKGGKTNPDIANTFNPAVKLPLVLTKIGAVGPRPTLSADLKEKETDATPKIIGKQALWDTGASFSEIDSDLIGTGANQLNLTVKNGRVIIPEVTFSGVDPISGGTDTLIIRQLQAKVEARPNDVPLRIGMNVLEKFKLLIDLHDDSTITGADRFFGLEKIPPDFTGRVWGGKVRDCAPDGSIVEITWTTGREGQPLLDADNNVMKETKTVPKAGGPRGCVEFTPPRGAEDFEQRVTVLVGSESTSMLRVEAFELVPSYEELREDGEVVIPESLEVGSIWDSIDRWVSPDDEVKVPDLFVDSDDDGIPDAGAVLYSAVDLNVYLESLATGSRFYLDAEFVGERFYAEEGLVYRASDRAVLPGFVVGLKPIEIDFLAAPEESGFINPMPYSGPAIAFAEHGLSVPVEIGDVTVILTWANTADLNLRVIWLGPDGEPDTGDDEIVDFRNPTVPSGGQLVVKNANRDCENATTTPIERIFWPTGQAPQGEYWVEVEYLKECHNEGETHWQVRAVVDGQEEVLEGTVSPRDIIFVTVLTR